MKERREPLKVVSVRVSRGLVEVTAECGRETATTEVVWCCPAEEAPRVGESVAIRLVELPWDRTVLQVLGLDAMGLGE